LYLKKYAKKFENVLDRKKKECYHKIPPCERHPKIICQNFLKFRKKDVDKSVFECYTNKARFRESNFLKAAIRSLRTEQ